jgi:hypothetical protein
MVDYFVLGLFFDGLLRGFAVVGLVFFLVNSLLLHRRVLNLHNFGLFLSVSRLYLGLENGPERLVMGFRTLFYASFRVLDVSLIL